MKFRVTVHDRRDFYPDATYSDVSEIRTTDEPTAPYACVKRLENNDLLVNLDYYELVVNFTY